ncbi:MAG: helix-turn-helix transcriptional regulator [Caulobacteraceae bacterium]|nr:helix-turn-helix transcriptional regulator [Caulobacteraceae bacterium]
MSGVKGRPGASIDAAPAEVSSGYLTHWAVSRTRPTAIVTLDMRLVWANEAAITMLREGSTFGLQGGQLVCVDKAQNGDFAALVARSDHRPWLWACAAGDNHMLVKAELIHPAGAPPAAVLEFCPAQDSDAYLWADIGKIFGLTPAETAVTKRVVDGIRADMIAADLNVTIETVRTHLRRAYSKLAVNSLGQMTALVGGYRLR